MRWEAFWAEDASEEGGCCSVASWRSLWITFSRVRMELTGC